MGCRVVPALSGLCAGGNSGIGAAICEVAGERAPRSSSTTWRTPRTPKPSTTRSPTKGVRGDQRRRRREQGRRTCSRLVDAAVTAYGRVDVWVNNAGIETRTSLLDTDEDAYDRVLAINLKSAFFGSQLAAKQFIAQGGGGVIVNVTSVHEDWPMPGNTPYCVSKGGMRMLTRTAGVELGQHGIRVVGVGPGAVDTPINATTTADPTKLAALDAAIPLRRLAKPEEIAETVVFLASDRAAYATATTVFLDGGIMQGSVGL